MANKINVNVVITKEDDYFIALCVENGVCSQGKTLDEAIANIKEAVELYMEVVPLPNNPVSSSTFLCPLEVCPCVVKNS